MLQEDLLMQWFENNIKDINDLRAAYKKLLIKYHPDNNVEDTTSTPSNIFQLNTLIKSYKMSIIIVRRKEVVICQLQQLN